MKNIMRLLLGLTCSAALVLAGCGGGSDSGTVDYNKLLSGNFQIHQAGDSSAVAGIETARVDVTADGAGSGTFNIAAGNHSAGASGSGSYTYSIASDRTVTVNNSTGSVSGMLSSDGGFMVLSDVDRTVRTVAPLSDAGIVLAAGMKKTVGLDLKKLSGNYQIHQFGTGGTPNYTAKVARVNIAADGNGSGTWTIAAISAGGVGSGAFTYTVNGTDGTFSVTTTDNPPTITIGTDHGIISADGSLFILSDTVPTATPNVEDTEIVLAVGVKKSTIVRTDADLKGTYQINQISDAGAGRYTARVNLVAYGDGTGTYSVIAGSETGMAGGSGSFTYAVNADGTFTVTIGTATKDGILSADGSVFVISDAETTLDPEIVLGIGMKK